MLRDPASNQLINFKKSAQGNPPKLLTGYGVPIAKKNASLTPGPRGPLLLQDSVFIDEFKHFDREIIPERVVHAKGAGAFGYFQVTHDITNYTKAKLFSKIGKKTDVAVRLSQGPSDRGGADLVRELRGLAIKFYTEEGIWDLVMLNFPVFFLRDPTLFAHFISSQKRNPVTNLKDPIMAWDFFSLRPESVHATLMIYSDRAMPDGYRHTDAFSQHAFKLVNDKNEIVYAKFNWKTNQGIKNLTDEEVIEINKKEQNYSIRDLYNAIAQGNYPSWTLYIQVMTPEQTHNLSFNPFDPTKVWPHKQFPLIEVGKLVLNKNPVNYFKDVEQAAYNPSHLVPGIEASPFDKILQARMFFYTETQRYRVGTNHLQLPINCPFRSSSVTNYQKDGPMSYYNQNGSPKYFPNSFNGPVECPEAKSPSFYLSGDVDRHDQLISEVDFAQAKIFWRDVLPVDEKKRIVKRIASDLKETTSFIIERIVTNFTNVDADLGNKLIDELRISGVTINACGKSAHL